MKVSIAAAGKKPLETPHQDVVQVTQPYGIGIDCHSKFIQVAVLRKREGEAHTETIELSEKSFPTTWPGLAEARDWATAQAGETNPGALRYCIESTGNYHKPVLQQWGGLPSVVNPLLAGPTRRKTDVLDARLLAHHSITGLWKPSFLHTPDGEMLRVLWTQWFYAQEAASMATNRLGSLLLTFGHTFAREVPIRSSHGLEIVELLIAGHPVDHAGVKPGGLPVSARASAAALVTAYRQAVDQERLAVVAATNFIRTRDWPIENGFAPGTDLLAALESVPGVGRKTAITWLAEVGDPKRFSSRN